MKRKKERRPPPKPFDPDAIRAIGGDVRTDGDFQIFEGNRYSLKGFLYKNFNMNAIIAEDVEPKLSELEKFEEAPEGVDIELPSSAKDDSVAHSFSTGDNVEVCQGELMHLQGKISSIGGNFITVTPKHEDLKVSNISSKKLLICSCKTISLINIYFAFADYVRVSSFRIEKILQDGWSC